MLQKFYDRAFVFFKLVEQEYASLGPELCPDGNHSPMSVLHIT